MTRNKELYVTTFPQAVIYIGQSLKFIKDLKTHQIYEKMINSKIRLPIGMHIWKNYSIYQKIAQKMHLPLPMHVLCPQNLGIFSIRYQRLPFHTGISLELPGQTKLLLFVQYK